MDLDQHRPKKNTNVFRQHLFLKVLLKSGNEISTTILNILVSFPVLRSFAFLGWSSEIKHLAWTTVLVILGLGISSAIEWDPFWNYFVFP